MKKIIIATDYSAEAENAANYAAALAAAQGHELVLFNFSAISIHALNARVSSDTFDKLLDLSDQTLNKAARALSDKYKIKVTPHLGTGAFYDALVTCINQHNANGVVMGMANQSVEQDLMGNTTTSTIHRLEIPLMAVPITALYRGIRKILFACDMERGVHNQVLENIRELAANFGATVEVLYVKDKMEILQAEAEAAEHAAIDKTFIGINYYYKNIQSGKITNAIQEEVKETRADMLVMAPYKYGFWDSIVHRSKTRMMASGNSIPLLSLPA